MTPVQKQAWKERLAFFVPIIIFLAGLALASEHRMTTIETTLSTLQEQNRLLQENQQLLIKNQTRLMTMMDALQEMHRH